MGLGEFESFIEILMAYRSKYHRQYITECLDSLPLKNKENGLLAQSRTKGESSAICAGKQASRSPPSDRCALTQDGGRFVTREVRIEELLAFLRKPLRPPHRPTAGRNPDQQQHPGQTRPAPQPRSLQAPPA